MSTLDGEYFDWLAAEDIGEALLELYSFDELDLDGVEFAADDGLGIGDALAEALCDEQEYLSPAALDDAVIDLVDTMSPAEELSFTSALGALPVAAQVGGTLVGGPVLGGVLGAVAAKALPRKAAGAAPRPLVPAVAAPPAAAPSTAAAQALVVLGQENQNLQKSLARLALGQPGSVGGRPVGAYVNLLCVLLQQAALDVDKLLRAETGPAVAASSADAELYADPASAEQRAEDLYRELVATEDADLVSSEEDS